MSSLGQLLVFFFPKFQKAPVFKCTQSCVSDLGKLVLGCSERQFFFSTMSAREMSRLSVSTAASNTSYRDMQAARRTGNALPEKVGRREKIKGKGERKTVRLSQILKQVPSSVEANKISVVEKYVTEVGR